MDAVDGIVGHGLRPKIWDSYFRATTKLIPTHATSR
ncbi:hypothetical protein V6Z11_D07G208400 [Gossypium hirsutum]